MLRLSSAETQRLRGRDHLAVQEPQFDNAMIRRLLRDPNCPNKAVPMLLALVDKPTGFQISYTSAIKRNPAASMRRRYAKPADGQVTSIPSACSETNPPARTFR